MKRELILAYWALAAISILWGTTWFISKLAIRQIPPLELCAIRQTTAGILFITWFYGFKKVKWPGWKEMLFHVLLGFLFFTCSNGLTTFSIKFIPSFLGALIGCLMPFILILMGVLFYKEKVKPVTLLGLCIGFIGIGMIILSFGNEMKTGRYFLTGVLLTLFTVFTWTGGSLLATRNKFSYQPQHGIGWQMFFGGLMLFVFSACTEKHFPIASFSTSGVLLISYLTLIGSIICFQCYLYALKHLPLGLVSIYVYINPIVALIMGVLFAHESINLQIILGVIITFLGIYMVKRFSNVHPKK